MLGVSALARDGTVPAFSNRDPIYNDIAAPGDEILSTFPRALTAETRTARSRATRAAGRTTTASAEGTSFAAPQVAAAAATLLARAAEPAGRAGDGAADARGGRRQRGDAAAGLCPRGATAHRLGPPRRDLGARHCSRRILPPRDRYEPNDDAGEAAPRL